MTMTLADYHFDDEDADTILLSHPVDNPTKFLVHRCILEIASPFFKELFTLPQPLPYPKAERAVISVSEPRDTLDLLLRFLYPIPDPEIESLDVLDSVLGAAVKYDLSSVLSTLRKILVSPRFLQDVPLRVFAIAARYELEEEEKLASRATLTLSISEDPPSEELKYITA